MSETSPGPAIAIWEFSSIPAGIECADAIVKGAPVDSINTGTTHPGKYVVLVAGDAGSVEFAVDIVAGLARPSLIDSVVLFDIAPEVVDKLFVAEKAPRLAAEAVGVVETSSVAGAIDAADAAVKHAHVSLSGLRLADGLGGKAYFVVDGTVGEVGAAVDAAVDRTGHTITDSVVIPQLTPDLRDDLEAAARFADSIAPHGDRS